MAYVMAYKTYSGKTYTSYSYKPYTKKVDRYQLGTTKTKLVQI